MTAINQLGYFAAALVLATFCAKAMVTRRALAIAGNVAFIAYALARRTRVVTGTDDRMIGADVPTSPVLARRRADRPFGVVPASD